METHKCRDFHTGVVHYLIMSSDQYKITEQARWLWQERKVQYVSKGNITFFKGTYHTNLFNATNPLVHGEVWCQMDDEDTCRWVSWFGSVRLEQRFKNENDLHWDLYHQSPSILTHITSPVSLQECVLWRTAHSNRFSKTEKQTHNSADFT